MKLLKLMQHKLTDEQIKELSDYSIMDGSIMPFYDQLTNMSGDATEIENLVNKVIDFLYDNKFGAVLLPIGSPAFMFLFSSELTKGSFVCIFAHSERKSIEETQPDGYVIKKSIFDHSHFIYL